MKDSNRKAMYAKKSNIYSKDVIKAHENTGGSYPASWLKKANDMIPNNSHTTYLGKNHGNDVEQVPNSESQKYYMTYEGGMFVLRQKRFKENLMKGREHPHDIMALNQSLIGLEKMQKQYNLY